MAQHDYHVADASGATVRADLNNALQAIATLNSGAAAPATTFAGQWWHDTATATLKRRNAANTAWITLGPIDQPLLAATDAAAGVVELLTQAELDARTDAARVPTAALLAEGLGVKGADIASAATLSLPTVGNYFDVTGTTTVTAISARAAGRIVRFRFTGALTLTHNATSLILQGSVNKLTVAGDVAEFVSLGSGNWRQVNYWSAAGGPGTIVQMASFQTGALSYTTVQIPFDDTIPQITEGNECMTLSFSPKSAANRLRIDVCFQGYLDNDGIFVVALFKDAVADALAAVFRGENNTAQVAGTPVSFSHDMLAGTTSAITFRVRAGPAAALTLTFNGLLSARRLGGVIPSSIRITEYVP